MSRHIDADGIQYTMLYKENWITNTGVEKQGVWKDDIDKIPTADVLENVKGRWVEVVDRTEMYDKEGVKTWGMLFQCNQCGFVLNAIEGHTGQYNYCPNCGADMRREDNGRDEENHNRV